MTHVDSSSTKIKIRLTQPGIILTVATVFMFVPAYWLSISLIFLMGSMFLGTVLFNWIMVSGVLKRVHVQLTRLPELYAGQKAELEFKVHNRQAWKSIKHLNIQFSGKALKLEAVTIPKIRPHEAHSGDIPLQGMRRGRARLEKVVMIISHPFGLVQASRVIDIPLETLIYPELLDSSQGSLYSNRETTGITPRSGDDFLYLSSYQFGDDVRRIHWKRSANLPLPVVKRDLTQVEQAIPRLFVPDACPQFEKALSLLATHFAAEPHLSGWKILTESGIVSPENREAMLQELALATPLDKSKAQTYVEDGYQLLYASDL